MINDNTKITIKEYRDAIYNDILQKEIRIKINVKKQFGLEERSKGTNLAKRNAPKAKELVFSLRICLAVLQSTRQPKCQQC